MVKKPTPTPADEPAPESPNDGLSPKQVAALDRDNDGFAGGELSDDEKRELIEGLKEELPPQPGPEVEPLPVVWPTVGRAVHFYRNSEDGPYAAIVGGFGPAEDPKHTGEFETTDAAFPPMVWLTVFTMEGAKVVPDVPYVDTLNSNGPGWRWPDGAPGAAAPALANIGGLDSPLLGTGRKAFGVNKRRG